MAKMSIFERCYILFIFSTVMLLGCDGSETRGKVIYDRYCISCHAPEPMISLGAPSFGNSQQWAPRLERTLPEILESMDNGYVNMPPRGGCFDCSDKQLTETIRYMLPKSLKRKLQ